MILNTKIMIFLALIMISIVLYFSNKMKNLHREILEHIKINYPQEYKELSISIPYPIKTTILAKRIRKNHPRLPKDGFLLTRYKEYKQLYKLNIIITTITVILIISMKYMNLFWSL